MTEDDIIRMAGEARLAFDSEEFPEIWQVYLSVGREEIKHFAALVVAAERNKVATWMMEKGYATGHGDTLEDMLNELDWQIRESERKRIVNLLMIQHEAAKGRHNYWKVAAELIQAEVASDAPLRRKR